MDELCNVSLVESVLHFMAGVDTYDVNKRINETEQCLHLMKQYADIPEVWVCKVHVVFTNIGALLAQIKVYHESRGNNEAVRLYLYLIDPLDRFEDARAQWLDQHPQELEFIFKKMRLPGFSVVKTWGVTDYLQFEAIKPGDNRILVRALPKYMQHLVMSLRYKLQNEDVDLISVRKIYEHNDVYSMHLRRQLIKLHEYIEGGQYHDTTTQMVSTFLHTVAYKMWGWGDDFVDESAVVPPGRGTSGYLAPQLRKAYILEVTGAPGSKADNLNGTYVETREKHNEQLLFKKTSMHKGVQYWLRADAKKKWIVSQTADVEANTDIGLCCTTTTGKDPLKKQWTVYDAEKGQDRLWRDYPAMKCEQIKPPQLLWALDDCDVVINQLPASEIQVLIRDCRELYMTTSEHFWWLESQDPDHTSLLNILTHLEGVALSLDKTLAARQAYTADEPGECSVCMDRHASEVLLNCKHLCVCSVCVKVIQDCPLCRAPIEASCNHRVYETRTSHSTERVFDGTARMRQQAKMHSLLLQLRDGCVGVSRRINDK